MATLSHDNSIRLVAHTEILDQIRESDEFAELRSKIQAIRRRPARFASLCFIGVISIQNL